MMPTGFPRRSILLGITTMVLVALLAACADAPAQGTQTEEPTATPASTGPPAAAGMLFIDADTVLGPANLTEEERPLKTCVQVSRFAHNEEIVWRVKVIDPTTGEPMDDSALDTVQVVMGDQTLDLRYGPHPRDNPVDFFWTVAWEVPEEYPSGTVDYTIEATAADGRTGTWEQFGVQAAMLTITDDVRPIISD